jgi:hypothetical protein
LSWCFISKGGATKSGEATALAPIAGGMHHAIENIKEVCGALGMEGE